MVRNFVSRRDAARCWRATALAWAVVVLGLPPLDLRAAEPSGEALFQRKCASCHGPRGEGTAEHHPDPLVGDKSVRELARLIDETMPLDRPEEVSPAEAERIAAYIHEAFYSEIAQARNRPARLELSRLTVRQYEHTVADLLAGVTGQWPPKLTAERGLVGRYFANKWPGGKKVLERREVVVDFDFTAKPPAEGLNPEEYSALWEGSLLAPDTGDYELIVESTNGLSLWVNNSQTPLIDARVRSGDQSEYRASLRLLGGRAYPLRLEWYKRKDDRARIALRWKPPRGVEEPIPARQLLPERVPSVFVLTTSFPPDDRSTGFERGSSVSKEWLDAAAQAALEVSERALAELRRVSSGKGAAALDKLYRDTARKFVEQAVRRPLTPEDEERFLDRQFAAAAGNRELAVQRVVLYTLNAPEFLYRETGQGPLDDHDAASWLSYALWDSLPDQHLFAAARRGQLRTAEQLTQQAERMLPDPRTRAKLRTFLHQWMHLDHFGEVSKNARAFPEFSPQVYADLRVSLDLFLDEVLWQGNSDYRQLFLAEYVFLNGRLSPLYGGSLPPDAPFTKVTLAGQQRAGILSHPFLMSSYAYDATSSPIHRGVFLARNVLGRMLKPPPIAVAPVPPDLHANLTTRQRVELQTQPVGCRTCHTLINPLGFSLENFDAIGRYRTQEAGRPIAADGSYLTRGGEEARFVGARQLAEFLVSSDETHEAFVEQLFHFTVKQPVRALGPEYLGELRQSFAQQDFNVQRLLVEMVVSSAVRARDRAAPLAKK